MSWNEKIVIVGVGFTPEREKEIKEAIIEKIEEKIVMKEGA